MGYEGTTIRIAGNTPDEWIDNAHSEVCSSFLSKIYGDCQSPCPVERAANIWAVSPPPPTTSTSTSTTYGHIVA